MLQQDPYEENDVSLEGESDLQPVADNELQEAIVNATDWTIETILSQINKGNILLNPKFQRRDAWKRARKSEFIESLFLGLPVPQIVLASHKERKGKYIIIDGKQRLLSIRQFASTDDDQQYEQLRLGSLEQKSDLNGKSLHMLKDMPEHSDDVNAFENETIRTVVIKHWPNEQFLYRVFLRLNTNSVGLSPQELRQALHPGPFIDYADEFSQNRAIQEILNITAPDFRMRDVEIFIRYFAFSYFIREYTGSMKDFLDKTCKQLNETWANVSDDVIHRSNLLQNAHNLAKQVFNNQPYRKWIRDRYERRFNRAIFDIIIYYFTQQEVINAIPGHEAQVEEAFKDLCTNDQPFLASIERTTKTIEATCIRLSRWAESLNAILGTNLHVFHVVNNRIV